jgi:DNA modification methylase
MSERLYLNADCMNRKTGLPSYPDNYFDLAIVDPPYGIGDLILDTHVGSASSLVVFEEMGFDYVAFEKDKDYYADSTARLDEFRRQGSLFSGKEIFEASAKQTTIFDGQ